MTVVFYAIVFVSFLASMVSYVLTQGEAYPFAVHDSFGDFFVCVSSVVSYPELINNYPPFPKLVYLLLSQGVPSSHASVQALRASDYGYFPYLLRSELVVFGICFLLFWKTRRPLRENFLLLLAISFTTPFIHTMLRGNNIVFAWLLTWYFVRFHASEGKYERLLAYFALVLAASIKLYPAVFGLYLIKEKNFKGILFVIGVGLILNLLFLLALPGSLSDNIKTTFEGIRTFSENNYNSPNGYHKNFSIHNWVLILNTKLVMRGQGPIPVKLTTFILKCLCWVVCAGGFLTASDKWKEASYAAFLCLLIPGVTFLYVLDFFYIPLVLLSDGDDEIPLWEKSCVNVLFGLLFSLKMVIFDVPLVKTISFAFMYLALLGLMLMLVGSFVRTIKSQCWLR